MQNSTQSFAQEIITFFDAFKVLLLGAFGGIVSYLRAYSKEKKARPADTTFEFSLMFINSLVGSFIAYLMSSIIPDTTTGYEAIIGFSGITSYQILFLIEDKFADIIISFFTGGFKGAMGAFLNDAKKSAHEFDEKRGNIHPDTGKRRRKTNMSKKDSE